MKDGELGWLCEQLNKISGQISAIEIEALRRGFRGAAMVLGSDARSYVSRVSCLAAINEQFTGIKMDVAALIEGANNEGG